MFLRFDVPLSTNELDYKSKKVTYTGIFFIPMHVTYLGLDSYLILLLFQRVHAGCKLLKQLFESASLQGLESHQLVLPQQTNSTFIILSFSPVKCISSLHFKRCKQGANQRCSILQTKYLWGFMIIGWYPAVADEQYPNHPLISSFSLYLLGFSRPFFGLF